MSSMKNILSLFAISILLSCTALGQKTGLITYNIRYDNPNDGENKWENRKNKLAALLNYYEPAFVGIQEGLIHQVEFLDQSLPADNFIGVGRDDGKQKGEYCALFYDARIFKVIIDSTFWLSETPGIPSNGWDANLNRICTYGLFEHLQTKARIWVMNTHFDHRGKMARENSASHSARFLSTSLTVSTQVSAGSSSAGANSAGSNSAKTIRVAPNATGCEHAGWNPAGCK